jgi:hypothetical protein
MAVEAADLKPPKGPVAAALFPGVQSNVLDANLEAYIARAETDARITSEPDSTKTDGLVRALALHYVFNDAFIEMNLKPLTLQVAEKGGHGYSMEQVRNVRQLADKYLQEFLGLLTPRTGTAGKGGTKAVPNRYSF